MVKDDSNDIASYNHDDQQGENQGDERPNLVDTHSLTKSVGVLIGPACKKLLVDQSVGNGDDGNNCLD